MTTVTKSNFLPYLLILSRTKANCGNKNIIFREDFKVVIRKNSLNSLSTFCVLPLLARILYSNIKNDLLLFHHHTLFFQHHQAFCNASLCYLKRASKTSRKTCSNYLLLRFRMSKSTQKSIYTRHKKMWKCFFWLHNEWWPFCNIIILNMIIQKCKFDQYWLSLTKIILESYFWSLSKFFVKVPLKMLFGNI